MPDSASIIGIIDLEPQDDMKHALLQFFDVHDAPRLLWLSSGHNDSMSGCQMSSVKHGTNISPAQYLIV